MDDISPLQNPVYYTAVNGDLTSVCYCYRTVHSVFNFYLFAGILIGVNFVLCLLVFIFGDALFEGKYRKEFSTEAGPNRREDLTNTVE